MIISKTPLRISLFGGGSDFPSYYKNHKAEVLGFALNRYNYILFSTRFRNNSKYKYNINYSLNEKTNFINSIKHRSVRETLKFFNFNSPFELHYNGDLPARSGLGSSSAFTVGLCKILNFLSEKKIKNIDLAKQAICIEQKKIKEYVGSQDQLFASVGGLNQFKFYKDKISINKIELNSSLIKKIEDSSLLVFTGISRTAEKIEAKKFRNLDKSKITLLDELVSYTRNANTIIRSSNFRTKELGNLLDQSWKLKKSIHKDVSNYKINKIYNYAISLGAYGGKLLGAGSGGFIYILCPKNKKKYIESKLNKQICINVGISKVGSQIISPSSLKNQL